MLADKLKLSTQKVHFAPIKSNNDANVLLFLSFCILERSLIFSNSLIVSCVSTSNSLILAIKSSSDSILNGCMLVNENTSSMLPLNAYSPGFLTKSTLVKSWAFKFSKIDF